MAAVPAKPKVVIVEGEIAAGKTELVRALAAHLAGRGLKVQTVYEPVGSWREMGVLGKFYDDPARYGYSFQTYAFATRVDEIRRAYAAAPDADVFLLERSPATDQIFMELLRGELEPMEMAMYATWCRVYSCLLPFDLAEAEVLYLGTSIPVCMRRLEERHREEELRAGPSDGSAKGGVSREYQERLRRGHESFFLGRHPSEFPSMPASPFRPGAVHEVGPDLADGNFRDEGPERDAIAAALLAMVGL